MVQFISLVSGSSGNASLITDEQTTLLIDCGLSGVKLVEKLNNIGLCPEDLSGMLITHEHSDHTKGVGVIARKYNIPIYATSGTFNSMNVGKIDLNAFHAVVAEEQFNIGSITIKPFSIPHDAAEPVGYSFFANEKKYTLATDIGCMTEQLYENLDGSDSIILESNHDIDMLRYGSYPYYLKERILGKRGHMSNDLTAEIAIRLAKNGTKHIMLAHLSHENNTPEIAKITTESALKKANCTDVELTVANRNEITCFEMCKVV